MDIKTLLILTALLNVLIFLFLFGFLKASSLKNKILNLFVLSKFLQAFAWIFLVAREVLPFFLSVGVANILIIIAYGLEILAITTSDAKNLEKRKKIFALVILLFSIGFLSILSQEASIRIIYTSGVLFFWHIVVGQQFLFRKNKNKLKRVVGLLYVILSFAAIFRIYATLFIYTDAQLLDNNIYETVGFVAVFLSNFIGIVVLLLLMKEDDEKNILSSEEKFKNFTEFLPQIVFEINTEGQIIYLNKQAYVLTGYSLQDMQKGLFLKDLFDKKNLARAFKNMKALFSGSAETGIEYQLKKKNGEVFPVLIYSSPVIKEGKAIGLRGIIIDITERKQQQEEITKLSTAVKQSSNTIVITDIDGDIEFTNPQFFKLTGYTSEEAFGLNPRILNAGTQPKEYYADMWNVISAGKTWKGEFHNKKKNGDLFWESVTISPVKNTNGEIVNYIALKEDITEKKHIEFQLKQQNEEYSALNEQLVKSQLILAESEAGLKESNKTKDKFFSIIAHDLRSPFTSILGFSELLIDNFDEYKPEKQKEFIKIVHNGVNNTFKLLENLLLWSRSQKGSVEYKPEKENLYLIIEEIAKLFDQSFDNKSIQLVNKIPNDFIVLADKNMLLTILRNLLSNAIKFTPKHGKIMILASFINENNKKQTKISITDTGVGISKEVIGNLFEIAENVSTQGTENEAGTGLGLILCREFVEKHNGKIWAESEEGKGSTFSFILPVY